MTEPAEASRAVSTKERSYGAAAHVAPLTWGGVIPVIGGVLAPVILWWWMRESAFVGRHARAAINFQLTMMLHYTLVFGYVFVSVTFGLMLLGGAAIFETVSMVRAARRARAGEFYEYRMCVEFVKGGEEK